jgi:Kef-type K+ transport system membrane component KefB
MLRTKLGVIAISAAAVDDAIAWCLLAVVLSLLSSGTSDNLAALWIFLTLVGYACFLLFVFSPIYERFVRFLMIRKYSKHHFISMAIISSAYFTEMIGVHAVFGGFLMGIATPRVIFLNHLNL